jgi:uncharacterized protein YifE (UPF0438 family)
MKAATRFFTRFPDGLCSGSTCIEEVSPFSPERCPAEEGGARFLVVCRNKAAAKGATKQMPTWIKYAVQTLKDD